jgi:hypothetical protein
LVKTAAGLAAAEPVAKMADLQQQLKSWWAEHLQMEMFSCVSMFHRLGNLQTMMLPNLQRFISPAPGPA